MEDMDDMADDMDERNDRETIRKAWMIETQYG